MLQNVQRRRPINLFDLISQKLNDEDTSSELAKSVGTTPDKVKKVTQLGLHSGVKVVPVNLYCNVPE